MQRNMNSMPYIRPDIRYGLLITAGLIVYFMIMKFAGLVHVTELRIFNFFIMLGGLFLAYKKFHETDINRQFNYMKAITYGLSTASVGTLLFAVFVFIYVSFLDPALMDTIKEKGPLGEYLNPWVVSIIIGVEGILSGALASFMIINVKNARKIEEEVNGEGKNNGSPAATGTAATKTTASKAAKSAT